MYVCVDAIVCICVCFKECGSSILGPPFSCCLCPWREVRTCLHGQEGGGGSDGRLPVCCSPRFFLKDALSTKSCSKPTTCTKHSVSNHCVSSFDPHSQIVWAEGLATLNRLQEGEAGPVEPTYFRASALELWHLCQINQPIRPSHCVDSSSEKEQTS